jgi:hypothetical protein
LSEAQQAHFVSGQADYEAVVRGRPLFHYFVFGAMVLLLFELGFQALVRRPPAVKAGA